MITVSNAYDSYHTREILTCVALLKILFTKETIQNKIPNFGTHLLFQMPFQKLSIY